MTRPAPRRLAVQHDYPRATAGLGRPVLEASRIVPLPRLFPRARCVSDGRAHDSLAWLARTAARRGTLRDPFDRCWS